jgi:O-methyltransferase involved in polyketide biosynthesis
VGDPDEIRHDTETALLTAGWRAIESDRPDALFHDPLAAGLAGERGLRIAGTKPDGAWVVAIRPVVIDGCLRTAISSGVDTVVNLLAPGWTHGRTGWISPRPCDGSRSIIRA